MPIHDNFFHKPLMYKYISNSKRTVSAHSDANAVFLLDIIKSLDKIGWVTHYVEKFIHSCYNRLMNP